MSVGHGQRRVDAAGGQREQDRLTGVSDRAPRDYSVFGGVLRSDLTFPELPPITSTAADWTLRVADSMPEYDDLTLVGSRQVRTETYRLWQHARGYRLSYSHAGHFDLDPLTGTMVWYPDAAGAAELARAIVIGPLFALLLEAEGLLCLHGSAVVTAEGAVAFIGPKHHGKSTLALALTAAGCQFASDDLVAIAPGDTPTVRPAAPSMRLWDDAANALRPSAVCSTVIQGAKTTLGGFHASALVEQPTRLAAIYVLDSGAVPADAPAVERVGLRGVGAVVEIAHQRKLADPLVGFAGAGSQLSRAAAVSRTVPVWQLRVARDFGRIQDVTSRIMEWHGGAPGRPGAAGQEMQ
jgi:hypothetical protein